MTSTPHLELTPARLAELRPTSSHGFTPDDEREIMRGIYARGDRLMIWFLVSHTILALGLALFHGTWFATTAVSGAALGSFALSARLFPRTFFTRAYAGVAQQAFVALHIYQLYGQSEQHFWYFTAFTMMIVYQDWACMWPGAILIIFQHSLFAALHNIGMPVHFFPEAHVGFTKLVFHFGIAIVHVALCGYWAHLLRKQTLGDAWQKLLLSQDQHVLEEQLVRLRQSESALLESSEALVESFRQQRAILDNSSDAMWIKDTNRRYIAVNAAFARFVGLPVTEIEGKTADDLLSADEVERLHAQEREVEAAREPRTREHELVLDGVPRVMETAVTPIFDSHDVIAGTTGAARDVTERKRLESARRTADARSQQVQKLESLGVLAGGIAHDFNNLLAVILGNAELARSELREGSPASESVTEIEQSAVRAAELTRQMLAYAGQGRFEIEPLDVAALIRAMEDDLRRVVSGKGRLHLMLAPGLPPVKADAAQMRQVLDNLVTNAVDALPDSDGVICLRTELVHVERDAPPLPFGQEALLEGRYVVVEVSDNGSGMSAEIQARIVEPFFTTKFVGRGLGLAAVIGILRAHGGVIDVHSQPGVGSIFRLYLPALANDILAPVPREAVIDRRPDIEAGGLILVVDDDAAVRTLASRIILRAGFKVRNAADGVEAIELLTQLGSSVSLVLLDMIMPRMNGEATLREIRRMMPGLPVLLTSGYSEEVAAHRGMDGGHVAFIQKPYRAAALVTMIRDLLESAARVPEPLPSAGSTREGL